MIYPLYLPPKQRVLLAIGLDIKKMEVGMSLNSLIRLPPSKSKTSQDVFFKSSSLSRPRHYQKRVFVVEAKGKKGMQSRQFQRGAPPPLPKIEEDGNPKFVIFIRTANVSFWYPLSLITGGTTAKIMVAAKDTFVGKYIYKDTIARNLAAVIYKDEKGIQQTAFKQYRALRTATSFRYGYKLVENGNVRSALSTSGVIELPAQEELKTVVDKVIDFFGDAASGAKESFGKITSITSTATEELEQKTETKN